MTTCNCGSGKSYRDCCQVFHQDYMKANHPELLMRSRYTAFTLNLGAYLLETHHPETRKNVRKKELIRWSKSVEWLRLEVFSSEMNGNIGFVEFKAHFKLGKEDDFIHEKSKFLFENNRWYYHSAV